MKYKNADFKPLRVLLVTQEEPLYLPAFFELFLSSARDKIIAIVILRSLNTSLLTAAKQLYNLYGMKDFLVLCLKYLKARFLDISSHLFPLKKARSIKAAARKHGIPVLKPRNINSQDFLNHLRSVVKPDLIVSISASQVFREDLLKLPPLGCVNIHAGPLPGYAGMMPSFWALTKGESETAVTLHRMTPRLDEGEIFMQRPLTISPADTLHTLLTRNKELGCKMLLQFLEDLRGGKLNPRPNDPRQRSYFHFPGKKDALEFRRRGRKFW